MTTLNAAGRLGARTKWTIAITVGVAAAGVIWAVTATRSDEPSAERQSQATKDMPGMDMVGTQDGTLFHGARL